MRIIDPNKSRAKARLSGTVQTEVERVTWLLGQVEKQISALDCVVSGAPSGMGTVLIEQCQRAAQELSDALRQLNFCLGQISRLDVTTWEDDYDFYRRY